MQLGNNSTSKLNLGIVVPIVSTDFKSLDDQNPEAEKPCLQDGVGLIDLNQVIRQNRIELEESDLCPLFEEGDVFDDDVFYDETNYS